MKLCKISSAATTSRQPVVITHCLTVKSDLKWLLYVHNNTNSLALVLISEGIRFTSSIKDVIAPRMTSQEAIYLYLPWFLVSILFLEDEKMKRSPWAAGTKT